MTVVYRFSPAEFEEIYMNRQRAYLMPLQETGPAVGEIIELRTLDTLHRDSRRCNRCVSSVIENRGVRLVSVRPLVATEKADMIAARAAEAATV